MKNSRKKLMLRKVKACVRTHENFEKEKKKSFENSASQLSSNFSKTSRCVWREIQEVSNMIL
ncbi:hypothetical protein GQX74_011849 [Glossina fuscipes]|nr:hypothetical protein GQX74_011849 [Glossina fuscipes]